MLARGSVAMPDALAPLTDQNRNRRASGSRPQIESGGGKALNLPDRVADDLYEERLTIAAAVEKPPLVGNRAELRR